MEALFEMTGIYKSFSSVQVLKGAAFQLKPGEIHALMGENGAGKSTLMKILTGVYKADSGSIKVKDKEVMFTDPKQAEEMGVAIIHQELNIIPKLTVAENMFLGRQLTYGKTGFVRDKEMKRRTREYLQRLGVDIDPDVPADTLSIGQQQMIEIAKALSKNAEVLIMDEPTAALTDREIEALFKIMNQLRSEGVGIVYISHRMEEIFLMCDRISVLRDGSFIGTENIAETTIDHIVHMMVGREIGERYPERNSKIGAERLRVENLSDGKKVSGISFSAAAGEIVGVAGLMGAGRTEIARMLFGADKKKQGKIFIDGQEVSITSPSKAIESGIVFVTEDRKHQGLVLGMSVRENLSLTNYKHISNSGVISSKKEEELSEKMIKRFHIRTRDPEQTVKSLSGGNQQKVAIGKWLGELPKVFILDEPTRGVDVGAKKEIYTMMNELSEQGVTIIMISSDLPEVLGVSDRVIVVHEGHIASILDKSQMNQETIMHAATGGSSNGH
ncbi:sugar ABC transporter ATP-binding protein [Paenibacillus sp. SC116]|uniref:sugar ABC transporter ATP-binding protein n=1 Tax=Paenibacillus sp. SC116 TaxID=2968986 RepID=UPI00215B61BA|nr:sugar ABC transporter ATP-binding protein [Paenibacillus sp. SC116]MCR8842409.1 sugar ABC transporter ATP-binding protein [Paenibacillus sp. SC116]